MDYLLVSLVALVAAGLTLFSGFGLGTLLLPAFAAFFAPEVAVGAVAVVHLANNIFKLFLIARDADRGVVLRFGIPAIAAATLGALLLERLAAANQPFLRHELSGWAIEITPVGLVVGLAIAAFAALEWAPRFRRLQIHPRYIPLGGLLSGFFGGLTGHQGALRSAFLIRSGLQRDQFVGTAAVCSVLVDLTRLAVYAAGAVFASRRPDNTAFTSDLWPLIAVGCASAFVGSFVGARLVKKVTLEWLQGFVAIALVLFGLAMAAGLL